MAVYHLKMGFVSRSSGRSSVQSAAYISGSALYETRRDVAANFTNRSSDVVWCETLVPSHLEALKESHPYLFDLHVWDKVESFEDEYAQKRFPRCESSRQKYLDSCQTSMTLVLALPKELSLDIQIELVCEFSKTVFTSRDLIVLGAIHGDEGNPHLHLQVTRRSIDEEGEFSWAKDRDICTKKSLLSIRKFAADLTNSYLKREGIDQRVSEKSFKDLGLEIEPTKHRGWYADKLKERSGGKSSSRIEMENESIYMKNRELILSKPQIVLDECAAMGDTFNVNHVWDVLLKRVGEDDPSVSLKDVFDQAMQHAVLVGHDEKSGSEIYSTKRRLDQNRYLKNPSLMVEELVSKQATFKVDDVWNVVKKTWGEGHSQLQEFYELAMKDAVILSKDVDGVTRYTTASYLNKESQAFETLYGLKKRLEVVSPALSSFMGLRDDNRSDTDEFLKEYFPQMSADSFQEQRDAVLGLAQENEHLSVLVGRAGSGKTTTLKAVSAYYQSKGYKVMGTSLSALAAGTLGAEADMESKTLASYLLYWNMYKQAQAKFLKWDAVMTEGVMKQMEWARVLQNFEKFQLTSQSVFMVDEASMIGTSQWLDVLDNVKQSGAKLIVVGDDHQLEAIQSGDMFREIKQVSIQNNSLFSLDTIRRQKVDWMAEASNHFANLETTTGLMLYEKQGHVQGIEDRFYIDEVAKSYVSQLKDFREQEDVLSSVETEAHLGCVLAFSNREVKDFNESIRDKLGIQGEEDLSFKNAQKQKMKVNVGEHVLFLKNDKGLGVSNGMRGVVVGLDHTKGSLEIQLSKEKTVSVNVSEYNHLAYGYAVTVHKSQGQTMPFSTIAASRYMEAKGFYVAMTRHQYDARVFYNTSEFQNIHALSQSISRLKSKELVLDYTLSQMQVPYYERVVNFRKLGLDMSIEYSGVNFLKDTSSKDWKVYHDLKSQYQKCGSEILEDFEGHKTYLNQMGWSKERLEMAVGKRKKPLSFEQEKDKMTLELFAHYRDAHRMLWNQVKVTQAHPSLKQTREYPDQSHPLYEKYIEMKEMRNQIAHEMVEDMPRFKGLIKDYGVALQITQKDLKSLVKYNQEKEASKNQDDRKENTTSSVQEKSKSVYEFEHTKEDIVHALTNHMESLTHQLLGKPTQVLKNHSEYRYGNKGSISVYIRGTKAGLYSNFETGVFGNVVTMISDLKGLESKDAFKWGAEWLGYSTTPSKNKGTHDKINSEPHSTSHKQVDHIHPVETKFEKTWVRSTPPQEHLNPDLGNNRYLNYMLKGRCEVARYPYTDAQGNIQGIVVRLENEKGDKITPTLTYWNHKDKDFGAWHFKGMGDNRPLYNLKELMDNLDKKVLIVEGEKTCDAMKKRIDGVCVTWSGGSGAVSKSDWSVLKGRSVVICPDHDQPGRRAALKVVEALEKVGVQSIKVIDLPSSFPHKWDLADPLPQGETYERVMKDYIQDGKEYAFKARQSEIHRYEKTFTQDQLMKCVKKYNDESLYRDSHVSYVLDLAQETYRTLKKMDDLEGKNVTLKMDEKRMEQSLLTGIYMLREYRIGNDMGQKDPDHFRAHFVGKWAAYWTVHQGLERGDPFDRALSKFNTMYPDYPHKKIFETKEQMIQETLKKVSHENKILSNNSSSQNSNHESKHEKVIDYAHVLCQMHQEKLKDAKDVHAIYQHVLHHPTRELKDLVHDMHHHVKTITKIYRESFKAEDHHLETCQHQKPMFIEKQIYQGFERSRF